MSVTSYNARVKFPSGDPYDAGNGPSINVAVEILDGNGNQDLTAPKLKDSGLTNIYKKADSKDAEYVRTLKVGDEITLQYIDQGKKSYYDFVIPTGWRPPPPRLSKIISTGHTEPHTYEPMPDGEIAARKAYIEQEAGLLAFSFHTIDVWRKMSDLDISPDTMLSTANGLRISSEINHKDGETLVTQEDVTKFKDDLFTGALDEDDMITTALDAIVEFAPIEYTMKELRDDLTYLGVQRSEFLTKKDSLNVAKMIWRMLEIVKGGMEKRAALSSVRDQNAW